MLVEVVDCHRVAIVGGLGEVDFFAFGGLLFLIATRVKVDVAGRAGLEVGNLDPDEPLVHHGVELFDLGGEQGLVIGIDEAQVAAILLGVGEVEVPVMQADHYRRCSDGVGNGHTIIRGVDRDLLSGAPGFIPPGTGVKTAGRQDHQGNKSK